AVFQTDRRLNWWIQILYRQQFVVTHVQQIKSSFRSPFFTPARSVFAVSKDLPSCDSAFLLPNSKTDLVATNGCVRPMLSPRLRMITSSTKRTLVIVMFLFVI